MLYTYTGATFSAKDDTKRFWKFILISSVLLVRIMNFRFKSDQLPVIIQ